MTHKDQTNVRGCSWKIIQNLKILITILRYKLQIPFKMDIVEGGELISALPS